MVTGEGIFISWFKCSAISKNYQQFTFKISSFHSNFVIRIRTLPHPNHAAIMKKTYSLFCILFTLIVMVCCNSNTEKQEGEMLVNYYCSSCHLPVMANALNKQSWLNFVLPNMGRRLGIKAYNQNQYVNDPHDSSRAITFENWTRIVNYYSKYAPDSLDLQANNREPFTKSWAIFKLKTPSFKDTVAAHTVMVTIDTASKKIYTADGFNNKLQQWNDSLILMNTAVLSSPAVHANFGYGGNGEKNVVLTTMGTMMVSDVNRGTVLEYKTGNPLWSPTDTIGKLLQRPVFTAPADFNKDGLTDWVVCCFGHNSGGLYWLQQLPGKGFAKKTIIEIPGATMATVGDYNNDGWPDIMVLFAHAQESIRLFLNDQHGAFTAKTLLQFLPVAGSSSFQLVDFNKDGLSDILYTSGDNSDFSTILKPYHGIYIYLNNGDFQYQKSWFYPVNGCTKAMAADFDLDGDMDIASIAFYADHVNNPAEKFIYFEQDAPLHFKPYSPPITSYGRWICMDVNDYDGDGDADIVLGNFANGFLNEKDFKPNWNLNVPMIVLENKTK